MDAIYYVSSLVGIAWLILWVVRLERDGKQTPSPFEMRDAASVPKVNRSAQKKRD